MISTPRSRPVQLLALFLTACGAVALAGGNVSANRLAGIQAPALHRSPIEPDLQRLLIQAGPRKQGQALQPIENVQEGLSREWMIFDSEGRVGIRVTARDTQALLPALTALGFKLQSVRPDLHLIEGFIPIAKIAELPGLTAQGLLGSTAIPKPMIGVGAVASQGDFVHEADRLRGSLAGLNGAGMRVGVISDSYNRLGGAAIGVASGDLPNDASVVFLEGPVGSSDEGRAMTEIVHDVAPGAEKRFGSAFYGEAAFGDLITDLANPALGNCNIITDDIFYFDEPMFQDGVIAQGIDAAVNQYGRAYFSLAGNLATQSYESVNFSPSVDGGISGQFHDFNPTAAIDTRQRISLDPGQAVFLTLQWDDPFYTISGVDTDLDLFLVRAGTNTVVASSTADNISSGVPNERFNYQNLSFAPQQYDIMIRLTAGTVPSRIKYVNYGANSYGPMGITEYATNSRTVIPHSASASAMSVGAVDYDDQSNPTSFTSAGPSTIYFSPTGIPQSQPTTRAKPDIAAIQGTNTTFFGFDADSDGFPNFYGTSAAAPHAAAIAALVWQNNPGLTPAALYSRLVNTATPLNAGGWDRFSGNGLINAYDAVFGPAVAAGFPYADGFESGVLSQAYETRSTGAGRIQVTGTNGPAVGAQHVILTTSHDGRSGRNEMILHVNAAGLSGAVLSFREREFNDADQPMSASFQGSENTDGVALSVDGQNWYRITSLTGTASTNAYQLQRYSLAAVAAANGLTLSADTQLKFQQFGNLKTPRGGLAFDDISILNLPGVSFGSTAYSVNEGAATAALTVLRAGDPAIPVQIDFATSDDTATTPGDYLSSSGTLLFQAGETSKTISIPIVSDRLIEGPETVNVSLSNISAGVLLTPSDVKLTILDDQDLVAPGNLTVTATGPSSVRLDWVDHSDNETEFQLERKVGVGQFTQLATVLPQVTTYSDAGLSTNTLYTYRVRAVAGSSASSYSNQVSVNISPIELEKGTYTVSEDAGFIVVRVTRSGDILSTASVQLATVDGTATAGLDYAAQALTVNFVRGETTKEILIPITADRLLEQNETFDVVLSNANGGAATLGDQKKATVTITNGGALPAPSNLAITVAGASQVQLTWKDNCTNETAIDIERRTGQGGFVPLVSLVSNSEAYTDNTVVAGTVYTYRVRASQGELVSNYSNEVSTAVTSLQFEVAGYSVLEDDIAVSLKVTRNGDPSLPVTVKYATSNGTATAGGDYASSTSTLVFAPAETSKTVTINVKDDDLLEGPETFNVTLSGATGTGVVIGSPGVAVVTITDNQVRLTPSNLSAAVVSGSQVQLNWTDNSGNETRFEIERRVLGGAFAKVGETAANVTVYTDGGLTANSSYTYRVRAANASGTSGYSNDASVTTLPPAPLAPGNLTAALQDGGKVRLTWTDNSLDEAGFVLERKDGNGSFALVAALAENSRSYTDTGRLPGHTYTYQVRSVNAGGESANSNTATVTLSSLPGTPSGLTASPVSSSAVRLDWTVGSNSTSTRIERRTNGAFAQVGTVAQGASTFVDQGVQAGVTYTYRVISASLSGESEPSNTVQVSISALARISVSPTKLAFGKAKAGAVRTKTFTIKNTGSGVLGGVISTISQGGLAPGAFEIVSGGEPFSLVRGEVRKVTVRFQTDTAGSYQGSLTITSSDPNRGTTTVMLSAASK